MKKFFQSEHIFSSEPAKLSSKRKWLWIGIALAVIPFFLQPIFVPLFVGPLLGLAFWSEPSLKKQGQFLFWLSLILSILAILLLLEFSDEILQYTNIVSF